MSCSGLTCFKKVGRPACSLRHGLGTQVPRRSPGGIDVLQAPAQRWSSVDRTSSGAGSVLDAAPYKHAVRASGRAGGGYIAKRYTVGI